MNFESQELVRRLYHARHGREANAAHAAEIGACFTQGAAYFESARVADRAVRPLLLYYGVLSLARGTSMFLRPGRREASLSQAHGLATVSWGETLARVGSDVGDLRVRVAEAGSFQEFGDATGNRSMLRIGRNDISQVLSYHRATAGQEFSLADLLSRLPEVIEQYDRWRQDGRCAIGGIRPESPAGTVSITMQRRVGASIVDRARVERVVNPLPVVAIEEADAQWVVQLRADPGTESGLSHLPGIWDYVPTNMLGIGSLCFAARYEGGWFGSKSGALFVAAYVLGMLARYFPSRWMALARNIGSDGGTPTLLATMSTIEQVFPQLVADFMTPTST
ncbi:MAG: hypothetical protein HZB39_19000 [Planctomycetes bacterium]|nr:hypothetical protein [Planctomycetota bacterium]